jgi:hypothetical protein
MHCCDAANRACADPVEAHIYDNQQPLRMEGHMTKITERSTERRGFFNALGRAVDAHLEFERLYTMSDRSLATMNLTRDQIPQYIISRL